MSAEGAKLEVAKDGVVRIPKTVFEPMVGAAGSSSSGSSTGAGSSSSTSPSKAGVRAVTKVVRLDGTVEEVVVGAPPNNPNFQPRQTVWSGKVVTNDKLEVKLKFHLRKGLPLTPELEAKRQSSRRRRRLRRSEKQRARPSSAWPPAARMARARARARRAEEEGEAAAAAAAARRRALSLGWEAARRNLAAAAAAAVRCRRARSLRPR